MVEFAGLGSDDVEVGLKLVIASTSYGCIYRNRILSDEEKSISVEVKAHFHDARPKGMQAPHWSVRYDVSMRRGTESLSK